MLKNDKGQTVKLHTDTMLRLKELKHRGQSVDGFISELMDKYSKNRTPQGQFSKQA